MVCDRRKLLHIRGEGREETVGLGVPAGPLNAAGRGPRPRSRQYKSLEAGACVVFWGNIEEARSQASE